MTTLTEVFDDLYDRVLGLQDAVSELLGDGEEWPEGEDLDDIPEPVYDSGEDDEYIEEDGFPDDEE
jgi:hypothetical protein